MLQLRSHLLSWLPPFIIAVHIPGNDIFGGLEEELK